MLKGLRGCCASIVTQRTMKVIPIPAFADNYQYLLVDDQSTNQAAIVDPVNITDIQAAVKKEGVSLIAGLVTHHHADHSCHADRVRPTFGDSVKIYGNDEKRIPGHTNLTTHQGHFKIGNLEVMSLHTPCHTSTHVCYFVADPATDERVVFTGDTLFIGGCGRFFEGTAAEMDTALNTILGALPDDTKVYCGHEYTVNNLRFAKSVDPNNPAVIAKLKWAIGQREANRFTIPSTIGEEKEFNPFMRVRTDDLQTAAAAKNPIDVMKKLRDLKNNM